MRTCGELEYRDPMLGSAPHTHLLVGENRTTKEGELSKARTFGGSNFSGEGGGDGGGDGGGEGGKADGGDGGATTARPSSAVVSRRPPASATAVRDKASTRARRNSVSRTEPVVTDDEHARLGMQSGQAAQQLAGTGAHLRREEVRGVV